MTRKEGAQSPSYLLPDGFTVTAHTGCLGCAENSIEAIKAGIDAGAQIVEFDLRFDPDGQPVLSHDEPTKDSVPLSEAFVVLRRYPQIRANVDVKETTFLASVPKLAEGFGVLPQIFFTGVEEKDVYAVREKCPGVPYYLNIDIGLFSDLNTLAEKTVSLGAIGVNISYGGLSSRLVRVFHEKGLLVSVWTIDTCLKAKRVLAIGPDNVTSRRPDLILAMIR